MVRGHLGGRSRKGETRVGLSQSPVEHHLTVTSKQGNRVIKAVISGSLLQLVSGSPYVETKQLSQPLSIASRTTNTEDKAS